MILYLKNVENLHMINKTPKKKTCQQSNSQKANLPSKLKKTLLVGWFQYGSHPWKDVGGFAGVHTWPYIKYRVKTHNKTP